MLVILNANTEETAEDYKRTWSHLQGLPEIRLQKHKVQGRGQQLTEIYLIGNTTKINLEEIESLSGSGAGKSGFPMISEFWVGTHRKQVRSILNTTEYVLTSKTFTFSPDYVQLTIREMLNA